MEELTLEILTKEYDILIFKHRSPINSILGDDQNPDINSSKRTLVNYKSQYNSLKEKLYKFPLTRFVVWTGAALVESKTNDRETTHTKEFAEWVKNQWDQLVVNIFIFDFREIETSGGIFLKPEYASRNTDSHPNKILSEKSVSLLVDRLTDVLINNLCASLAFRD